MNPIQRLAALKLVQESLAGVLKQAQAEADEFRKSVGATGFKTDWGTVSVAEYKPSVAFTDEAALVAYAQEYAPHLVEVSIPPEKKRWLAGQLAIDGEDVIDPNTGEVVAWAKVKPGYEVVSVRNTPEAKVRAAGLLGARVDQLTAVLTEGE